MKNLVIIPFAFDSSKQTGVNINTSCAFEIYLKNICVASISTKRFNPAIDVAVVCNFKLPEVYEQILLKNNILIFIEEFDSYCFPNDYKWNLAFYKLCALEKVVDKYQYDNYLFLDADVIVQDSFEAIFEELSDNILMYDINHGLNVQDYRIILQEFKEFGISSYITHYGGEFFASSRGNAQKFLCECKKIFNQMISDNFVTTKGDEFIISIAAFRYKNIVKNAGAYIYRFWTGSFYLVSTCYKFNSISVLHLPNEKGHAIIKIFDKYIKHNKFPKKEKIHKMCHLHRPSLKVVLKSFIKKIFHKH